MYSEYVLKTINKRENLSKYNIKYKNKNRYT
jgi:hypothetical protein